MVGGALTLLLAGSLALSTPAFAQESEEDGEVSEETTVSTDDSDGTEVEIGDSGEGEEDDSAGVGASGTTAGAAAAPATASGAAAPTTLPSTGVGAVDDISLALIALAAAGAVAAGAVAVRGARQAEELG